MEKISKKEFISFIEAELEGNLSVLLDPQLKDSFSSQRVKAWMKLVAERIYLHLNDENNK